MKRILLFIGTNILVVVTISIVASILGVTAGVSRDGINIPMLAAFCLLWGMAGSFISLQLSRWMAKRTMGIELIEPGRGGAYEDLYNMVVQISKSANLPNTPEVGIYQSDEINAFATGPSKSRSLVAFSTGLLHSMNRKEIEGVAAHEIAHISNGDMVTMTLLQGIMNAFVMFLARIIAFGINNIVNRNSDSEESPALGWTYHIAVMVVELALLPLSYIVISHFSRQREFRADAGAAKLTGKSSMTAALQKLQQFYGHPAAIDSSQPALATMKISGSARNWFSTHPSLEDRIAALQKL